MLSRRPRSFRPFRAVFVAVLSTLAVLVSAQPAAAVTRTIPDGLHEGENLVNGEVVWVYDRKDINTSTCYETQAVCRIYKPDGTFIQDVPYERDGIRNSVTRAIKPVTGGGGAYDSSAGTTNPLPAIEKEAVANNAEDKEIKRGFWRILAEVGGSDITAAAARLTPWAFGGLTVYAFGPLVFHALVPGNDTTAAGVQELNVTGIQFVPPDSDSAQFACGSVGPDPHPALLVVTYYWGGCAPSDTISHDVFAGTTTLTARFSSCDPFGSLQIPSGFGVFHYNPRHIGGGVCGPAEGIDVDTAVVGGPLSDFMPDLPHPPAAEPTPTQTVTLTQPAWPGASPAYTSAGQAMAEPGNQEAINAIIRNQGALPGSSCKDDCLPARPDVTYIPVPVPLLDETYGEYGTRLNAIGLQAHQAVLASPDYDSTSGSVATSIPAPGTFTAPGTDVEVDVNPTYDDQDEQRCDRSIANHSDPRSSLGFDPPVVGMYDLISIPGFVSSFAAYGGRTAFLRWGRTRPTNKSGTIPWDGWGYRHIYAKHGWTLQDQTDTANALKNAPATDGFSLVYLGNKYKQNGIWCRRRVIVRYIQNDAEARKSWPAKGIVTSYAEPL